jgi:hypothetical protein
MIHIIVSLRLTSDCSHISRIWGQHFQCLATTDFSAVWIIATCYKIIIATCYKNDKLHYAIPCFLHLELEVFTFEVALWWSEGKCYHECCWYKMWKAYLISIPCQLVLITLSQNTDRVIPIFFLELHSLSLILPTT